MGTILFPLLLLSAWQGGSHFQRYRRLPTSLFPPSSAHTSRPYLDSLPSSCEKPPPPASSHAPNVPSHGVVIPGPVARLLVQVPHVFCPNLPGRPTACSGPSLLGNVRPAPAPSNYRVFLANTDSCTSSFESPARSSFLFVPPWSSRPLLAVCPVPLELRHSWNFTLARLTDTSTLTTTIIAFGKHTNT